MRYYISQSLDMLSEEECKRLQVSLKVILRDQGKSERLKRTIISLLSNVQKSETTTDNDAILTLLDHCGTIHADQLTDEQRIALRRSPFTVWPQPGVVQLSGEAFDLFKEEPAFANLNYLFARVVKTPSTELQAWARWLARRSDSDSFPSRKSRFFDSLIRIRSQHFHETETVSVKAYENRNLYDILSPEEYEPMSWFRKGVVSLYRALDEIDRNIHEGAPLQNFLNAMLTGKLVPVAQPLKLNQPVQYKVQATRECAEQLPLIAHSENSEAQKRQDPGLPL